MVLFLEFKMLAKASGTQSLVQRTNVVSAKSEKMGLLFISDIKVAYKCVVIPQFAVNANF